MMQDARNRIGGVIAVAIVAIMGTQGVAVAQTREAIDFSVAPTMTTLNISPGETWKSALKIGNPNAQDLTMYATVVDIATDDSAGSAKFTPVLQHGWDNAHGLADWITITSVGIDIPGRTTKEFPIEVSVPPNAEPGGHYAAVLIGTRPLDGMRNDSKIIVSGMVASVFFLGVNGNVDEDGLLREFYADHALYRDRHVVFDARFQNRGNVHLQPQGDITIYNMWGQKRGTIAIDQQTNFGTILPDNIKKLSFEWDGEENIFDIGRYRAVATLTYGGSRKTATAETAFWIVTIKPLIITLLGFLIAIGSVTVATRAYIGSVLKEETGVSDVPHAGRRKRGAKNFARIVRTMWVRKEQRIKYGATILGIVIGMIFLFMFFKNVLYKERQFEIRVRKEDGNVIRIGDHLQ